MYPLRIAVQVHPQHATFDELRRAWRRLDEMGVDVILVWDHFFPLYGPSDGPHFEGWTTLAFLAAETRRAQLGHLVLAMSYRNPALLSQMAKTLDHATGGRFILGLGAGWSQRDYDEYGYEFGTPGQRLRHLEQGIEIIKQRWQRDQPRPLRETIPILIGGGGEKVTLRITAQHAHIWHGFGTPEEWTRKSGILDDWCRRVGRDPATIERSANVRGGAAAEPYVEAGATLLVGDLRAPFEFDTTERLLRWRDAHQRSG